MSHLPWKKNSNEPSSPVKLKADWASLAPIRVPTDCSGVVDPVESAMIEGQVRAKSESAYKASPLIVIIYPPPHQERPPILITVDSNTTARGIKNRAATLFCMSPTIPR